MLVESKRADYSGLPVIVKSGQDPDAANLISLCRCLRHLSFQPRWAQGMTSVVNHLTHEFRIVMQLAGTKTVEDVKHAKLLHLR